MERHHITYKSSRISYLQFGSGPRTAFCFHGYGEEAASYAFLEKYAGDQYSFFAIDLPFHGQTEWKEGLIFTTNDLVDIMDNLLATYNKVPPFSLIGFSLGGRMVLSLYEIFTSRVDRIVLLAPDGLKVNFWYWLATQTWLGKSLFAFTMKKPAWFFRFLQLLNRLKMVNSSIFKFVNYYIGDPAARELLYARWVSLRKFKPDLHKIKSTINQQHTPVRLLYGKHDRIILPVRGEKFRKGIETHCQLSVIHSGHQVLHEKHAREILPALLQ